MNTWNLSVRLLVDRPVTDDHARRIGQTFLTELKQPAVVSTSDTGPSVSVSITIPCEDSAILGVQRGVMESLANDLALMGYDVRGLAALEALTPDETERRLANASIPPMVNTEAFAELCGVSRQRISELETIRRAAAAEDKPATGFPTPVVTGWWLKSAAERYAATRRRKPGPAPRNRGES